MAIDEKAFQQEIKYLQNTIQAIKNRLVRLGEYIETQVKDVTEMKRHLVDDAFDIDAEDLVSTHNKVNDLVDFTNAQVRETYMLKKGLDSPYFGRIDFAINNDPDILKIYVGLTSIEDDGEYYVFDWRAPVAELFYESGLGKASYKSPSGKISGEVVLKRQFSIKKGELIEAYDVGLNIADEFLQNVLAEHKNRAELTSIASSIQDEQNKIIRNNYDNILVIQGQAGSGKTTVALHRIAYALYCEKNLSSSNVLILSPNSAFNSYISGVLPELGEDNTRQATFVKFIKTILKTSANVESIDEFVERYSKLKTEGQEQVLEKLCGDAEQKMDTFLENYFTCLKFTGDMDIGSSTITEEELNKMLQTSTAGSKLYDRINNINENIALQGGIISAKATSSLKDNLVSRLNASIKLFDVFAEFCRACFNQNFTSENISFEDACLLCVLKNKLQSIIVKMDVRSIIIDEAQDYPFLFFKFLFEIFPRTKFTILGDKYQKTIPCPGDTLKAITEKYAPNAKYVELERTYRSSEEIVSYTSKILGLNTHNAFRLKNGRNVIERKLTEFDDKILEDIKLAFKKGDKLIGVLAESVTEAKSAYKKLKSKLGDRIGLVSSNNETSLAPVVVIPALLAKGLEFECAIVLANTKLLQNKNLFYIACTRAIHGLIVYKQE